MRSNKIAPNPIDYLQSELNGILGSFINGGFSSKGYILYPAIKDVSPALVSRTKSLVSFAKAENFIDLISLDISNSKNTAIVISLLYRAFEKSKPPLKQLKKRKIKFKGISEKDYSSDFLKPVIELMNFSGKNLKKYLLDFHLHGSLATLDYVEGWSDFDTLAVIKKETLQDYKKILELREIMYTSRIYLYKIDPLQHHGHMTITEYDLEHYCNSFFPVELFDYSKSFFEAGNMEFAMRDSSFESIRMFEWFAEYFKGLEAKNVMSSYGLKFFLHTAALFPAIYLQAGGQHMYKKFSFDVMRNDFSKKEFDAVDYFSSIRKNWKSQGVFQFIKPYAKVNPLLAFQINAKLRDIFCDVRRLNKIDLGKLVDGMKMLAESAEMKIL